MNEKPNDDVVCPFCGEKEFDLQGLKTHLEKGWCEIYNDTPVSRILFS